MAPVAPFTSTHHGPDGHLGRRRRPPIRTAPSPPTPGTSATRATGTGATTRTPTPPAGTYKVKLTVTDNNGGDGTSVTNPVTVAPAPAAVFALRSVRPDAWPPAGAPRTRAAPGRSTGTTTNFLVGGGAGTIKMASAGPAGRPGERCVAGERRHHRRRQAWTRRPPAAASPSRSPPGGSAPRITGSRSGRSPAVRFPLELVKTINGTETGSPPRRCPGSPRRGRHPAAALPGQRHRHGHPAGQGLEGRRHRADRLAALARPTAPRELQAAGGIGIVTYLSGSATNAPVTASFDNLTVKASSSDRRAVGYGCRSSGTFERRERVAPSSCDAYDDSSAQPPPAAPGPVRLKSEINSGGGVSGDGDGADQRAAFSIDRRYCKLNRNSCIDGSAGDRRATDRRPRSNKRRPRRRSRGAVLRCSAASPPRCPRPLAASFCRSSPPGCSAPTGSVPLRCSTAW